MSGSILKIIAVKKCPNSWTIINKNKIINGTKAPTKNAKSAKRKKNGLI